MRNAYFAGGCFWCVTPTFDQTDGVLSVTSGYCGGDEEHPTYEQVKAQKTGHRETVRVSYDETRVSYRDLVRVFLSGVDPFDDGGQFVDRGFSYTLAVYYENGEERAIVQEECRRQELTAGKAVAVSVEPVKSFWSAEEYHQDYYKKNPEEFRHEMESSGRTKQTK